MLMVAEPLLNKTSQLEKTISVLQKENVELKKKGLVQQQVLAERDNELTLLKQLGREIISESNVRRVLLLIAEKVKTLIGCDSVLVPMLDESREHYIHVAAIGENADRIMGSIHGIDVGMCGWVLSHEKPLLFGRSRMWWVDEKTRWEEGKDSALMVPLFGKKNIIGGLSCLGKVGGDSFSEYDLELLNLFANQVSTVIENAQMLEHLTQRQVALSAEITERKRIEQELRLSEKFLQQSKAEVEQRVFERTAELELANDEIKSFGYSVSHDLRAPLRAIDGFSQILIDDYADILGEEGAAYLQRVRAASQRMGDLIDGMLMLSHISQHTLKKETVSLSEMAHDIIQSLHEEQPHREVLVEITKNILVIGDRQLLHITLENLLANAWKYTGKLSQAKIEFGEKKLGAERVFYVKDNGSGFDMRYAGKLFEAFQRLHGEDFEGSGIGLATVQRAVRYHGGRVWASSDVEKGTEFSFTLKEN
jgi:signal transduction histidine kinase